MQPTGRWNRATPYTVQNASQPKRGEKDQSGFHLLNISLYPQPLRKGRVLWEHLTPFPTGPKCKASSCCAAHTGSPQQRLPEPPPDTTQAVHPMPEGTPLFLPSHQCSGSCVCAWPTRWHWQKGFALSFFPPLSLPPSDTRLTTGSGQTDAEKDCHLLKPSHRLPTQLAFPPHLPSRYPPSQHRSCWLHQTARQQTEAAQLKRAYLQ